MCGRYSIFEAIDDYLRELAPEQLIIDGYEPSPVGRYNVAPSTAVEIIRPTQGGLSIDQVKWGWAPFWAAGKRPAPINARVETVTSGRFFRALWPAGRALAPANGWFEWVEDPNDPKRKQPVYIRLKTHRPMFFAALAQVHSKDKASSVDGDGFVIITSASDAGMVDIHDRRPVVQSPEHAREWLTPDLSAARAEEIAFTACRPVSDFEWFEVSKAVGNVHNQGSNLIAPLS